MLLSGGVDSATTLYLLKKEHVVRAITFEYKGISRGELKAAARVAERCGVEEHRFVRLPDLKEAGEIQGVRFEGRPPTYIPMRNCIFYSYAASYAEEVGSSLIAGGHNSDDSKVFSDLGPRFFGALGKALRQGSPLLASKGLKILRPLESKSKQQVVAIAADLGVPLGLTWSCHEDGDSHCWRCSGCMSRRESFMKAGVRDPLDRKRREKIT